MNFTDKEKLKEEIETRIRYTLIHEESVEYAVNSMLDLFHAYRDAVRNFVENMERRTSNLEKYNESENPVIRGLAGRLEDCEKAYNKALSDLLFSELLKVEESGEELLAKK